MRKRRINLLVGVEILDELKEIGKTDGLKVSEIIRRCISDYLLWRKAKPVNELTVAVGSKEFDAYMQKQADASRIKADKRSVYLKKIIE